MAYVVFLNKFFRIKIRIIVVARKSIKLLKVSQWMGSWASLQNAERNLPSVPRHFYMGSMPLKDLRALAGVPTRTIEDRQNGSPEVGYQRALDKGRSKKVGEYVRWGFPVSSHKIAGEKKHQLVNPGWLPGAIIVNVRLPSDIRRVGSDDRFVYQNDIVSLSESLDSITLDYPDSLEEKAQGTHPIEIIDGQHRVFSIDDYIDDLELSEDLSAFDVPVVFFHGLDVKWQAYLFWVINVEPKKINPSLAFDLYPELRRQDWLEEYDELKVYREHRAQELTELLWRHTNSPWKGRIELLGNRRPGHVSNAAFIRSLLASFVKNAKKDLSKGGLFGSVIYRDDADRLLQWSRPQQAALLIEIWSAVKEAVLASGADWVMEIAESPVAVITETPKMDAFSGRHALLSTDQGVRAVHGVFNDFLRNNIDNLSLNDWVMDERTTHGEIECQIDDALDALHQRQEIVTAISRVAGIIVDNVDWRLPTAPGILPNSDEFMRQSTFRGGSGYRLLYEIIQAALASDGLELSPDSAETEGSL